MDSGKDAIIFIPGLIKSEASPTPETITDKFTRSLDRIAERPELVFRSIGTEEKLPGENEPTLVHSIAVTESAGAEERTFADVYHFDYRETLTKTFKSRNPITQIFIMLFVAFATSKLYFTSMFSSKSKSARDQLQMLTVAILILSAVAYASLLIIACISTQDWGVELIGRVSNFLTFGQEPFGEAGAVVSSSIQKLIVIFTTLGLFNQKSLKAKIGTLATSYVCACNYVRLADRKPAIAGELSALLEHISEKTEPYRNVHIIAYSFGTLVALDFLFPHYALSPRSKVIQSLTTIGCPFDLVRGYWPEYFSGRNRHVGTPQRWINHFAPLDVFGSNFRDDVNLEKAEKGLDIVAEEPCSVLPDCNLAYTVGEVRTKLDPLEILAVKGIKIHSQYWNAEDNSEISCFDQAFDEIYRDEQSFKKQIISAEPSTVI